MPTERLLIYKGLKVSHWNETLPVPTDVGGLLSLSELERLSLGAAKLKTLDIPETQAPIATSRDSDLRIAAIGARNVFVSDKKLTIALSETQLLRDSPRFVYSSSTGRTKSNVLLVAPSRVVRTFPP